MASTVTRRPLPALVSLLALLLLTALVWWRVLHRSTGSEHQAVAACPTPTTVTTLVAPESVTVQVLNATSRTGIAAKARTTLIGDGFQIPRLAANDSPKNKIPGVAEIRYGPSGKPGATVLRYYFPGAKMVVTSIKTSVVTVSLGSRYRSVASPAAVQRAMQADKVAVAAPSGSAGASGSASC
ncbi:MAG TPA: LytR C-terminal domain-containing protein [Jatrophihabitans sp.]|jgi:hypothetical protein|nr:LytR C-terminal domain-containing protein [Jatrophihabitans sp.]